MSVRFPTKSIFLIGIFLKAALGRIRRGYACQNDALPEEGAPNSGGPGRALGSGPRGVLATSDEEVADAFARRREFQVGVPGRIGYTVTLPADPA